MQSHTNTGVYVTLNELLKFSYIAKGFSFLPSQPVHSILSGRHKSKMRGRGMDFSEMKQYVQGDDTRTMDWKATRRTGKPYIRVFNEERDRNVWLVVSQRNSMFFGTKMMMKSVAAAHFTALCAFKVIDSADRVGAVVYNDEKVTFFKPQRSKQAVVHILSEVVKQNQALNSDYIPHNSNTLNKALQLVSSSVKHDDLIILIGDGQALDEESKKYMTNMSLHNDILAVLVSDPMENEIPQMKSMFLSDGKISIDINSTKKSLQKSFTQAMYKRKEKLKTLASKYQITLLSISTQSPVLRQIQAQLGSKISVKRSI
jgi:uncharacterized protein (DUF58 family)